MKIHVLNAELEHEQITVIPFLQQTNNLTIRKDQVNCRAGVEHEMIRLDILEINKIETSLMPGNLMKG